MLNFHRYKLIKAFSLALCVFWVTSISASSSLSKSLAPPYLYGKSRDRFNDVVRYRENSKVFAHRSLVAMEMDLGISSEEGVNARRLKHHEAPHSEPRKSADDDYPFRNTSLSWDERVEDLVSRLTDHELMLQMSHGGRSPETGPAPAIPRLGIGPYVWNTECLRGDVDALENATAFPQAIGLAASFSPDLIYRVASATGEEVRGKHNDFVKRAVYASLTGASCFSPVINIVRDGRWGRVQETYGEDPFLTGLLAESFVKGLQGNDSRYIQASAGCKHFDAYAGPEKGRGGFDAKVSEHDLRMTFLPAFRKCVKAGTFSVMCSYNAVNGVPACANHWLLTDILRKEWGFTGYVVSDDTAVEQVKTLQKYVRTSVDAASVCVKAGTNLELSATLRQSMFLYIEKALAQGNLTSDLLRERTRPLFYTRMRLGEFDPPADVPYSRLDNSVVETPKHRALAVEAAIKSFVLLKNKDGFLPLAELSKFKTVAVLGPMSDNMTQLSGDYAPHTSHAYQTTPLAGLRSLFPSLKHQTVCLDGPPCMQYNHPLVKSTVSGADLVFVALGTGQVVEAEARDRENLDLPGHQKDLLLDAIELSDQASVVVLLYNAGPLNVTFAEENDRVTAILEGFFPAQEAGTALAEVLTNKNGNSGPAGRLPVTWPMFANQLPPISDYSMTERTYRYMTSHPLYPFGYGLSYTTFSYNNLTLASASVGPKEDLKATVVLENTGSTDSDEVVQCYIAWGDHSLPVPRLQLAFVSRPFVPAGSQTTIDVLVSWGSWSYWDKDAWQVRAGAMKLYCGGQQPNQQRRVPSNVLEQDFKITSGVAMRSIP